MNAPTSSTVIASLAAVNPIPKAWRSSNRDGRDKSGHDSGENSQAPPIQSLPII